MVGEQSAGHAAEEEERASVVWKAERVVGGQRRVVQHLQRGQLDDQRPVVTVIVEGEANSEVRVQLS